LSEGNFLQGLRAIQALILATAAKQGIRGLSTWKKKDQNTRMGV